jgi:hypothetical protein
MRSRWWFLLGLALAPLAVALPIHGADAVTHHYPEIRFNDPGRYASLTIPTPGCRGDQRCTWELIVNEPFVPGQPVVGAVYGTSGVLYVRYPPICGVIQADAIVGPPPKLVVGYRHQINDCGCPTSPQIGLTALITRPPTGGGVAPDQLALFLGLAVVAGALGRRRTT